MNPSQNNDNTAFTTPKQGMPLNIGAGDATATAQTQPTGFQFGAIGATPGGASSFQFPQTTPAVSNPGLSLAAPTTTTRSSLFNFPKPAVAATTAQLAAPVAAVPTSAPSVAAPLTISAAPTPVVATPIATSIGLTQLSTKTTTTQSTPAPLNEMNFCQMEELINKFTLELEEQEKIFTNQATQVNVWDKVLLSNSDKIINLSEAVEKVKNEQQALEQKLEYIAAQHSELDECITPLQKELTKIPHVDVDKAQTYLLAESLDTQLKQMSEDLKEVIEHLNETNKIQDSSDPIVQIGKILNAHMTSLQWIESNTSYISGRLQDITEMHNSLQKDNERSLRLAYHD